MLRDFDICPWCLQALGYLKVCSITNHEEADSWAEHKISVQQKRVIKHIDKITLTCATALLFHSPSRESVRSMVTDTFNLQRTQYLCTRLSVLIAEASEINNAECPTRHMLSTQNYDVLGGGLQEGEIKPSWVDEVTQCPLGTSNI